MIQYTQSRWISALFLAWAVSGCAPGPTQPGAPNRQQVNADDEKHLIKASYDAVDRMLGEVETSRLRFDLIKSKPLIVASFVNIDNIQESSTFGRIIGEQVGSRFSQNGYPVVEVKMRADSVMVREGTGELVLSRHLQDLSFEHSAQAVVAGTYAQAKDFVYVTMKLIRAEDGIIVYSYDYRMPMDADTKRLLNPPRKRL